MKKIEAIIRPERIEAVKAALAEIGVSGLTATEAIGSGNHRGKPHTYRGSTYTLDLLPKIRLEVIVRETDVERVVETLCDAAATGEVGDGKIFVSAVEDVIRVRTRERGEKAI